MLRGEGSEPNLALDGFVPAKLHAPMIILLLESFENLKDKLSEARMREMLADPELRVIFADKPNNPSLLVRWLGAEYSIFLVPTAMPREEFSATLHPSTHNASSAQIAEKHRSHVVVSTLSVSPGMGEAIAQSINLILVANAIGQLFDTPMGYFWANSGQLRVASEFNQIAERALEAMIRHGQGDARASDDLPLSFWVGMHLFSRGNLPVLQTRGLAVFAGHELQIGLVSSSETEKLLHLANTVAYLFARGPILTPGETIIELSGQSFEIGLAPTDSTGSPVLMLRPNISNFNEKGP